MKCRRVVFLFYHFTCSVILPICNIFDVNFQVKTVNCGDSRLVAISWGRAGDLEELPAVVPDVYILRLAPYRVARSTTVAMCLEYGG